MFANHYILPDGYFNGECLININISIPKRVMNINICCILNQWLRDLNTDFTLGNFIFGYAKLTKNADPDKYVCTGCCTGFDLRSQFSLLDCGMGKLSLFLVLI